MKRWLLILALSSVAGCATTRDKVLGGMSLGVLASGQVTLATGHPDAGIALTLAGLYAALAWLYFANSGSAVPVGATDSPASEGDGSAPAETSGSYKEVSIFNGQANCAGGSWAQGPAVILDSDGYYKECDLFNGQCDAPGTWAQGKAVILDSDGYYKECDLFNGKCDAPGVWYRGEAVVWCAP